MLSSRTTKVLTAISSLNPTNGYLPNRIYVAFLKRFNQNELTNALENSELASLMSSYASHIEQRSFFSLTFNPNYQKHATEYLDWLKENKNSEALLALWKAGAATNDILPRLTNDPVLLSIKSVDEYIGIISVCDKIRGIMHPQIALTYSQPAMWYKTKTELIIIQLNALPDDVKHKAAFTVFHRAAEDGDLELVEEFLKQGLVDLSQENHFTLDIAFKNNNAQLFSLLVKSELFTPDALSHAISELISRGNVALVTDLLASEKATPQVINQALTQYFNTRSMAFSNPNNIKNIRILIDALGDNVSLDNEILMRVLKDCCFMLNEREPSQRLEMDEYKVFKAIFKKSKFLGIPLPSLFDEMNDEIFKQLLDFYYAEDKIDYFDKMGALSDIQRAVLDIIVGRESITAKENLQRDKLVADGESAMNDSVVLTSKAFFDTQLKTAFKDRFNEYSDPSTSNESDKKKSAIVAIEREIRSMILDSILSESRNDAEKEFIKKHRDILIAASDDNIMRTARETYFNSESVTHCAWRGYDTNAPCVGFDNLLTPPQVSQPVFATRAAHTGGLTNVQASDEIREMVAYYYLLVTDENDGGDKKSLQDRMAIRKMNFISELADLRRAHSHEHPRGDNTFKDAPSCYPGYFGRLLNMGYEHPLGTKLVSNKTVIPEIMRKIILDKFKESLKKCANEKECSHLLMALSNLTERDAIRIFLKEGGIRYDEGWLKIRNDFIQSLGNLLVILEHVNNVIVEQGHNNLSELDEKYVVQYLLDPAGGNMMGPLGDAYTKEVKTRFYKEEDRVRKIQIDNPFTAMFEAGYKNLLRFKLTPSAASARLKHFKDKEQYFNELVDYFRRDPFLSSLLDANQLKGVELLLTATSEVLYDAKCDHDKSSVVTAFLNLLSDIESQLQEKSENADFPAALEVLQNVKASTQSPSPPTAGHPKN